MTGVTQRSATLARGTGPQRKIILNLEAEMTPLGTGLEGLTGFISEAMATVEAARPPWKRPGPGGGGGGEVFDEPEKRTPRRMTILEGLRPVCSALAVFT